MRITKVRKRLWFDDKEDVRRRSGDARKIETDGATDLRRWQGVLARELVGVEERLRNALAVLDLLAAGLVTEDGIHVLKRATLGLGYADWEEVSYKSHTNSKANYSRKVQIKPKKVMPA